MATGRKPIYCDGIQATGSIKDCLQSWTYLHNETVNIFSHIFGALIFFAIPIYVFTTEVPPRYRVATTADKVVSCIYFIGVMMCFICSASFHTIMSHSATAFARGMQLDFQGIILLMWGANIPLIYYAFVCDRTLQIVYWSIASFLAVGCSIATLQPKFSEPHLRPLRAATFASLALLAFIPVIHGIVKYGYGVQHGRIALWWVLATLGLLTSSGIVYSLKFPEKWFPRRFDVFGASHQIMHILVVLGGISYTLAVLGQFDYWHEHTSQCS